MVTHSSFPDSINNPLQGIYNPYEQGHNSCGNSGIASLNGQPSYDVVTMTLESNCVMRERGSRESDGITGGGTGVSFVFDQQWAKDLYNEQSGKPRNFSPEDKLGVAQLFLPKDEDKRAQAKALIEKILQDEPYFVDLGDTVWRDVPVNDALFGETEEDRQKITAYEVMPHHKQLFIPKPEGMSEVEFENRLYAFRKLVRKRAIEQNLHGRESETFEFASCSVSNVVYKAPVYGRYLASFTNRSGEEIEGYFQDFKESGFKAVIGTAHTRYPTNVARDIRFVQPLYGFDHNGEINTISGNIKWWEAFCRKISEEKYGAEVSEMLFPITDPGASDSYNFAEVYEFLRNAGYSHTYIESVMMPEAIRQGTDMVEEDIQRIIVNEAMFPPAQGPAHIIRIGMDGTGKTRLQATLDAGGYRPSRYQIVKDKFSEETYVVIGSEDGAVTFDESEIIARGRLGPGESIAYDLDESRIIYNDELKREAYEDAQKLGVNYEEQHSKIESFKPDISVAPKRLFPDENEMLFRQHIAGYTRDEVDTMLYPMAKGGAEPKSSMGAVGAPPSLSPFFHHLHQYFRQFFAQVTNPPIDPIREKDVTALRTFLPISALNIIDTESGKTLDYLELDTPFITNNAYEQLEGRLGKKNIEFIDAVFDVDGPEDALEKRIEDIKSQALAAARQGRPLVISDMAMDYDHAFIDMEKVVWEIHNHLLDHGVRDNTALIIRASSALSPHAHATLIGAGADSVNGYLAEENIWDMYRRGAFSEEKAQELIHEHFERTNALMTKVIANHGKAQDDGQLKIMSKMGISHVGSYRGAMLFHMEGIDESYMPGVTNKLGGITIQDRQAEIVKHHLERRDEETRLLVEQGLYNYRQGGLPQAVTPQMTAKLQQACQQGNEKLFREYLGLVNRNISLPEWYGEEIADNLQHNRPIFGTDLFTIKSDLNPLRVKDVSSVSEIVQTYGTAPMSIGALSMEAHGAAAAGSNMVGALHEGGEGGLPNYATQESGDNPNASSFQSASGRFGQTIEAIGNSGIKEINIKMSQGAKPGEGGQLGGEKVGGMIQILRDVAAGTVLISPPPNHDIYSIEDLKQHIYTLKQANPNARICVKLTAKPGIGQIARGVALAGADKIHISDASGGTGSSPLTSIQNAGGSVEEGLAEVQQALMNSGIRGRVKLSADGRVDSPMRSFVLRLLGADDIQFGTDPLRAVGCDYLKDCHTNTCPPGIATQDPKLREHFKGVPEDVANFYILMAQSDQKFLARLGLRTIEEVTGRTDLLEYIGNEAVEAVIGKKYKKQYERLLARYGKEGADCRCTLKPGERNEVEDTLDQKIMEKNSDLLNGQKHIVVENITPDKRSVGVRLSYEVYKRFGREPRSFEEWQAQDLAMRKATNDNSEGSVPEWKHHLQKFTVQIVKTLFGSFIDVNLKEPEIDEPILKRHPHITTLKDHTLTLRFKGSAGQDFGAFLAKGITAVLEGAANDGFGKSLSGGILVVKPAEDSPYRKEGHKHAAVGQSALYGATAGEVYICGTVGQRFGVKATGQLSFVCEGEDLTDTGISDRMPTAKNDANACEYMTGGTGVYLGAVGGNFGAGMSGEARAYVYDPEKKLGNNFNRESVKTITIISGTKAEAKLKTLIQNQYKYTESQKVSDLFYSRAANGRMVWDERKWENQRDNFRYVVPIGQEDEDDLPPPSEPEDFAKSLPLWHGPHAIAA